MHFDVGQKMVYLTVEAKKFTRFLCDLIQHIGAICNLRYNGHQYQLAGNALLSDTFQSSVNMVLLSWCDNSVIFLP